MLRLYFTPTATATLLEKQTPSVSLMTKPSVGAREPLPIEMFKRYSRRKRRHVWSELSVSELISQPCHPQSRDRVLSGFGAQTLGVHDIQIRETTALCLSGLLKNTDKAVATNNKATDESCDSSDYATEWAEIWNEPYQWNKLHFYDDDIFRNTTFRMQEH